MAKTIKIYAISGLLFFTGIGGYSQNTFQKTWGGVWDDFAYDIAPTLDSNYVITGSTYNSALSCNNILLMKVNTMGDTLWTRVYGTSGGQTGRSVIPVNDSGFIAGVSAGGFIGNKGNDVIIFKTDDNGNLQWSKIYGGLYSDDPVEIIEMPGNGYIFFGHTLNYGYFDTTICKRGTGDYCPNILIFNTNEFGDTLWTKVIYNSAGKMNILNKVIRTKDNGFLMVGKSDAFNTLGAAFLIKIDSAGKLIWSKAYKNKFTEARGVIEKENGNLIVMGQGWWDNSNWMNTQGIIIAETDSAGNLNWVKITDNGNDTTSTSETMTCFYSHSSYIYLIGGSNSFKINDSIYISTILTKFNFLGNIDNAKGYVNGGWGYGISATTNNDKFYIAGPTWTFGKGNIDVFLFAIDSSGNSDCNTYDISLSMKDIDTATITEIDTGFIVGNTNTIVIDYPLEQGQPQFEMQDCDDWNSIEELLVTGNGLRVKIVPNPNEGRFEIAINPTKYEQILRKYEVRIMNIFGQDVKSIGSSSATLTTSSQKAVDKNAVYIDISEEPAGIYFIKVVVGEEVFFGKIIIQ